MVYIIINTFPGFKSIQINKVIYYLTFIYNMVLLNRLKKRITGGIRTLIVNILKVIMGG